MVRLNDRLAGAAPDTGRAINSLPVGEARSAAPTVRVQRTEPAAGEGPLERGVRWPDVVQATPSFLASTDPHVPEPAR